MFRTNQQSGTAALKSGLRELLEARSNMCVGLNGLRSPLLATHQKVLFSLALSHE